MKSFKLTMFIIALIILIGSLVFLEDIMNLIPDEKVRTVIIIIIFTIVVLFMLFLTYSEAKKKLYTTSKFIILNDLITIVLLIFLAYFYFKKQDANDINELIGLNMLMRKIQIIFYVTLFIRPILTIERFKKQIDKIN